MYTLYLQILSDVVIFYVEDSIKELCNENLHAYGLHRWLYLDLFTHFSKT
jgi:hypothetical protein